MASKFCFILLIVILIGHGYQIAQGRRLTSREDDLDLEEQLKILNKPAIMSIQDESGVLFDCIDIYTQPAFDHPLLKNHTIQMKPTSSAEGFNTATQHADEILKGANCPEGTVPIRRTLKEDLISAKQLMESESVAHQLNKEFPGEHLAAMSWRSDKSRYHGAEATLNIINPKVDDDQNSRAIIWIRTAGSNEISNAIHVGWAVFPRLYRDHNTHLFTYWKSGKHGCHDHRCSGFVQVNHQIPLGLTIPNISVYDGPQIDMKVSVHQDVKTKNWWLSLGRGPIDVGYWPASLFTGLREGATNIDLGGAVGGPTNKDSPTMGYGYFPALGYKICGYFGYVKFLNADYTWTNPSHDWWAYEDSPKCYHVYNMGDNGSKGYNIEYGGSGAGEKCGI